MKYIPQCHAYMLTPARPLPPYPVVSQFNTTALRITWKAPFAQTSVAGILYYTVRVFSTVSLKWKLWTISAPNASSCHLVDISEDFVRNCDDFHNNESVLQADLHMFIITKSISDGNCDKLMIYVSASNALGESERAGVEGIFPTGMLLH